jgi:phosphoglycolate phosphatase
VRNGVISPVVKATTLVFDFDGTLADSLEMLLSIGNRLAVEFRYPPVTYREFQRLRSLSSREILKESRVSLWRLPGLLRRLKQEQRRMIGELEPIEGVAAVIEQLYDRGVRLGIVTSNSQENVEAFLVHHDLRHCFDFVYAGTVFGKGKLLRRMLRQQHLRGDEVMYVGDEVRDIQASHQADLRVCSVAWGFNTAEALRASGPTILIHDPKELLELVAIR